MFNITLKIRHGTKWNNEYFRTCCFSQNVAFNAIEAFQQGQEYHGPDIWQKYEKFGIDILDFACICYTWASRNTL